MALRSLGSEQALPRYPAEIHDVYIHIPLCSGVCSFCGYFLVPINPKTSSAIDNYLKLVKKEISFHAQHTQLAISSLYFGGGTPSLIPPSSLQDFLGFLRGHGFLAEQVLGTAELHPEFFADQERALRFLDTLASFGIRRVSIGYQESNDKILEETHRRHYSRFLEEAIALIQSRSFYFNIDLMYGFPGQTLADWETTLRDVIRLQPDSISTYFLFVDRGTKLYERVRSGTVLLPDHRQVQVQHLMAQIFLKEEGYWELPNDFFARGSPESISPPTLPSACQKLPRGPGAYGFYDDSQLCNVFDLHLYRERVLSGASPLWRAYRLDPDQAYRRDLMFFIQEFPVG